MLKELIRYTDVADQKVIRVFREAGRALPEAERLFSHVLTSQFIWICRITGEVTDTDRFDLIEMSELESWQQRNIAELYNVLEHADLSREITYWNSEGKRFNSVVADILFHVVNHSTYHRAQVAAQFRLNGITPPVTDYIILKRKGEL